MTSSHTNTGLIIVPLDTQTLYAPDRGMPGPKKKMEMGG